MKYVIVVINKMHTKEMIMNGLQELHDSYDLEIKNFNYRGSMEIYPTFTIKELAKHIGRTTQTTLKWCHVLKEESLIVMGWKRCYFATDSMTYAVRRNDVQLVKLIPFGR